MEAATVTAADRQAELRPRVEAWVEDVGGWSLIRARDIARVVMHRHPDLWKGMVVADQSMSVFLGRQQGAEGSRAHVGNDTLDALEELTVQITEAEDPRAEFFGLLREASGLMASPVESETGWPFRVELVPMDKLYADDRYQRPVDETFVRKTVLSYEEPLIGVIDVASTTDDRYAIMDGLQRFTASGWVGKTAMWAAIYDGLDVPEQARFFHHKNRDRKTVHPYYHFRARAVAGDPDAKAIQRIVKRHGFQLGIPALQPDVITAIRAVEEVFSWKCESRDNALDPTLEKLHRLWYGVKGGKDGHMIRGMGRFFAVFSDDEIQWQHLEDQLAAVGPMIVLGRAKDMSQRLRQSQFSIGVAVARALVVFHNTGLPRADRLGPERLFMAQRATAA